MKPPDDGLLVVLFSLRELARNSEITQVTRRHLTSFLYFVDLFRPSYGMWVPGFAYGQWHTGLVSYQIDATLAFFIANATVIASASKDDAKLDLTPAGESLTQELRIRLGAAPVLALVEDVNLALRGVSATSLASLCRVVYSEDSFRDTQLANRGEPRGLPSLGTPYHPAVQAQAVVERFLRTRNGIPPPKCDTLIAHLRYLAILTEIRRAGAHAK